MSAERLAYSLREAADMLGVPLSTVRGWADAGVLPVYRIHEQGRRGRVLVTREGLMDLLARSKSGGKAG